MADVFISYASQTRSSAQRIAEAIRQLGYDVWLDDQLPPHRAYAEVIEERLGRSRAVVVLWSAEAAKSQWVRAEADFARTHGKLVQVTLDGRLPPMPFNQVQCADLSHWSQGVNSAEWAKVVDCLTEMVHRPRSILPSVGQIRRRVDWRQAWLIGGLGVLVLAAAGLAWLAENRMISAPAPSLRVAVLPFDVEGAAPDLNAFAEGMLDETLTAMSSDRVQALSRTDSLALRNRRMSDGLSARNVAFFVDGAIRRVGDEIKVKVFLNDAGDHTTLWSAEITRNSREAEALAAQVAARCADVAHTALVARQKGGRGMDTLTLAKFVDASDQISNGGDTAEQLLREVTRAAPGFALAHARLSIVMDAAPDQSVKDLIEAKRKEAERALALDPHTGEAYLLLSALARFREWSDRESMLTKGIAAEPDLPYTWHFYNKFLGQTGRIRDALGAAQRVAALNYFFVGGGVGLCVRLAETGGAGAADSCQRADRLWPRESYNDLNQFLLEIGSEQYRKALDRLSKPDLATLFEPAGVAGWSRLLHAESLADAAGAKSAARTLDDAATRGEVDERLAYVALAMTGQVDAALRLAGTMFRPKKSTDLGEVFDTSILFVDATAAVRKDPRFMAVARDLQLLDYWRRSGKWPDFCNQPGLTYDCRKSA